LPALGEVAFQFLLVRLRDPIKPKAPSLILISIPSGAIKRAAACAAAPKAIKFQFLLVRLRE